MAFLEQPFLFRLFLYHHAVALLQTTLGDGLSLGFFYFLFERRDELGDAVNAMCSAVSRRKIGRWHKSERRARLEQRQQVMWESVCHDWF